MQLATFKIAPALTDISAGLALVTRPRFSPAPVPMAYPAGYKGKSCLCFPSCSGGSNPCSSLCLKIESCLCCRGDCMPDLLFADDFGAKFGAFFAMFLRWCFAGVFLLLPLMLAMIGVVLITQSPTLGLIVMILAVFSIVLLGFPILCESVAGALYFLWYFMTHGKTFLYIPVWVYLCCLPSVVAWLFACCLGCCICCEQASGSHLFGVRPVVAQPQSVMIVQQ